MSIASAYGLQYDLPQRGVQQGQPVRGGRTAPPQDQSVDFGENNLLDQELYVKEGMTDEYYKKVSALKSFANEVSSRYGFDVTKPNYRNPDSIRFHRSYMEALADLQGTQNRLKRLASQENLSLTNPNIKLRTDEQGQTYSVNAGENDVVKGMRLSMAQVKSKEGLLGFEAAREDLIEQLNEEASTAQTPQERDQAIATIQQLQSLQPDVNLTEFQNEQLTRTDREFDANQDYRNKQLGLESRRVGVAEQAAKDSSSKGLFGNLSSNNISLVEGRMGTIAQLTNPESLKTMGFTRVDRASGTYLEKTVNGKTESIKIDPNDKAGTFRNINELLNQGKGSPVSMDLFNATNLPVEDIAGEIIGRLKPVEDKYSNFVSNFPQVTAAASKDAETRKSLAQSLISGSTSVPANISASFSNGVSEDLEIKSVDEGTGLTGSSPYIKITLKGKGSQDKTTRTRKFYLGNEEDVNALSEIFRNNERTINIPNSIMLNYGSPGTVVAPNTSGGPAIDLSKM